MLNGQIEDTDRNSTLNMLIRELKRTHVTRHPMRVSSENTCLVHIYDERCPTEPVVELGTDGYGKFTVTSPYIRNEKYRTANPDYHTRKTTDLAKVRRWLKEYTKPYEVTAITDVTLGIRGDIFQRWKVEFYEVVRNTTRHIDQEAIIEDVLNYARTGVPYQSPKFAPFLNGEFIKQVEENEKRFKTKEPCMHVLLERDGIAHLHLKERRYTDAIHNFTGHIDTLDPHYRSKIAMLKIVDVKTFIPDVGVRLDTHNFWVY